MTEVELSYVFIFLKRDEYPDFFLTKRQEGKDGYLFTYSNRYLKQFYVWCDAKFLSDQITIKDLKIVEEDETKHSNSYYKFFRIELVEPGITLLTDI